MKSIRDFCIYLHSKHIFLILIVVLAAGLRLWNLNSVPPSASLDESSIGYNAYSVLKTGGDEFGKFPLISQRGYDDYRRSTYLLLVVPFVAIFHLTPIAVRLPAAILGILTVWAAFEISLMLLKKRDGYTYLFAYASAMSLAISPWHVYISRLGHESNACLSFLVFGVLFFLKGLENKKKLLLSALFLTLSMISYYSGQVLIPLLVIGLFVIYRKKLLEIFFSDNKTKITACIIFLLMIPVMWSIFSPEALIRFRGTSTFSPAAHEDVFRTRVLLRNNAVKNHDLFGMVYYNQHLFPLVVLISGYVSHFDPQWLFTNTTNGDFKAPNVGLLYPWQIPFILLGLIVFVLSKKLSTNSKLLVFLWFFLGPLPASIATQTPHPMRSYNILPSWEFLTAFGITFLVFKFYKYRKVIGAILIIVVFYYFQNFCNNYFVVFPKEQSKSFQYAYGQSIYFVLAHEAKYKKVVFSNTDNMFQSYMIFLFYSTYDPRLYQKQGGTKSGGYAETHFFGKYEFRPVDWKKENTTNILYVLNPQEVPSDSQKLYTGTYLNGKTGAVVITR